MIFTPEEILLRIYEARTIYNKPKEKILSREEFRKYLGNRVFERMSQTIRTDPRKVLKTKIQNPAEDFNMWGSRELRILSQYANKIVNRTINEGIPIEFGILMYGKEFLKLFKKVLELEYPGMAVDDKWQRSFKHQKEQEIFFQKK